MNGCLRVLLAIGVVIVLGIGALVFFGLNLWNRYGPSVRQFVALPQQIQRVLPELGGVDVNL